MSFNSIITKLFEKFPEYPIKNDIRYFLSFSPLIPSFISDLSPIKGYEKYYHVKAGDVVVDAGAFTGDYTVFAARRAGPSGKVVAFEPDEKNRRILRRTLNHERLTNVIIVPKGLWNKNTTLSFQSEDGLHSTLLSTSGQTKIDVVRLDDELKKLGIKKIDVLKMDIEGAEIEAIQGSVKTLKESNVHVMIASYHIVDGKRTSFYIEDFLRKHGYKAKSDFKKHLTTYGQKN